MTGGTPHVSIIDDGDSGVATAIIATSDIAAWNANCTNENGSL